MSSSLSPAPEPSQTDKEDESFIWRPLPDELVHHITTYFEEGLHYQALTFLNNLLSSGTVSNGPVFVPPPFHLSVILTLTLHPKFTIHASTTERRQISAAATLYLSSLLDTAGPIPGGFAKAYIFDNHAYMRGGRRRAIKAESSDDSEDELIDSDLARADGFFKRADDFWHALGWAFSCSVSFPLRWETWNLWCSHMIELLEEDIRQRSGTEDDWISKTLLVQFIGPDPDIYKTKRIVRAIFSGGTGHEFREIWKDETIKKRRKAPKLKKRVKLDIEAGELGDYGKVSSSSDEEDITRPVDSSNSQTLPLGPPISQTYRMRFLALLSHLSLVSSQQKQPSFIPLRELYTIYLAHLRPLSLQTLYSLLTPINLAYFPDESGEILVQCLARSFLETAAPQCPADGLTWNIFEKYYAPWASSGQTGASTVGDNGKVGVCVEAMASLCRGRLGYSPLQGLSLKDLERNDGEATTEKKLWQAVVKGCKRREERAGLKVRRAKKGEAGAEFDFEQSRDFEVAFLKGARMRLGLLMGARI